MYKVLASQYHRYFYDEWKVDPGRHDYSVVFDHTLIGNLDTKRLKNAIRRFVKEHFVFNSVLLESGSELYWLNDPSKEVSIDYFENELPNKKLLTYIKTPFVLTKGPLCRFLVCKIDSNEYRFIVVLHRIVIDNKHYHDFFKTVSNYYNNDDYVCEINLDNQFSIIENNINKRREKLNEIEQESKKFWNKCLSSVEPVNLFFLKLLNNVLQTKEKNVKTIGFNFDTHIIKKITQLNKKQGISSFLYGQVIFSILLYKHIGIENFAISYSVNIDDSTELMYGANTNIAIMPVSLNSNSLVTSVIESFQAHVDGLSRHEANYSLFPIHKALSNLSKTFLDVSFSQVDFKEKSFDFRGVTSHAHNSFELDLTSMLSFEQNISDNSLNYRVKYDANQIDHSLLREFVTKYIRLFTTILDDLLDNPKENFSKTIEEYQILTEEERYRILSTFNTTNRDYPRDKTIHLLFEEQVDKTPNNCALIYKDKRFTYKELNAKSNQLSHYINFLCKIKPNNLIVMCLDRNEEIIIAILAILKLGAAYVAIDPKYPEARVKYMLNDTGSNLVITSLNHKLKFKDVTATTKIVVIDDEIVKNHIQQHSVKNIKNPANSSDLAYVVYTSGSTGTPKGVSIQHNSVVNFVMWFINQYNVSCQTSGCQYASIGFDASVIEIYPILLSGGKLCMVPEEIKLDVEKVNEFFYKNNITYAFLTTKFGELFLEVNNDCLDNLLLGGERLERYTPQKYQVFNVYGPTEATALTTVCMIDKSYKNFPIGKPLYNMKCYVADSRLNPLPVGAVGELLIGGDGLARGYHNQQELTKEKFITNPFQTKEENAQNKNTRLYKTGDLARWLPDGNLEFVGRNDNQIKLRGYRIDLGEIETILSSLTGIKQSVVILTEKDNNKFLVGYYVSEKKINNDEIVSHLSVNLPDYMIPNAYVQLESFPLTVNGKLDYKSLPETVFDEEKNHVAPRNDLERMVSKIWAEILGMPNDRVNIEEDFFKIGGSSILSVILVSKLKNINLKFSPKDIYAYRTIKNLCDSINKK